MTDSEEPTDDATDPPRPHQGETAGTETGQPPARFNTRDAAATIAVALARAIITVAAVLLFYAWLPSDVIEDSQGVLIVATVGMILWTIVVAVLLFRIGNKPNALLRLVSGLMTIIVLLVAVFAQLDLLLYSGDPGAYSEPLNKTAALYFSMTVTATVGFGDIVAVSETARYLVTFQMLINMVFLAAAIKGILGAAQISHKSHPDERPRIIRKHAERQAAAQDSSPPQ
ncbi:MAG: potassium channel family protein [Candidatus Nanopelagicales bacterium]